MPIRLLITHKAGTSVFEVLGIGNAGYNKAF